MASRECSKSSSTICSFDTCTSSSSPDHDDPGLNCDRLHCIGQPPAELIQNRRADHEARQHTGNLLPAQREPLDIKTQIPALFSRSVHLQACARAEMNPDGLLEPSNVSSSGMASARRRGIWPLSSTTPSPTRRTDAEPRGIRAVSTR